MTHHIHRSDDYATYSGGGAYPCPSCENPVDVRFATEKLKRQLSSHPTLQREWGADGGRRIAARLQQLAAAVTLEDMRNLPGRCHELTGDRAGQLAVDLRQPYRLILEPTENPPPQKADGGLDWTRVDAVTVIEIVDYH